MSKIIIFDKKFRMNTLKYIFQCFLAALTILAILIFLDLLTEAALITALAASGYRTLADSGGPEKQSQSWRLLD